MNAALPKEMYGQAEDQIRKYHVRIDIRNARASFYWQHGRMIYWWREIGVRIAEGVDD